jgi:hypothetical protein
MQQKQQQLQQQEHNMAMAAAVAGAADKRSFCLKTNRGILVNLFLAFPCPCCDRREMAARDLLSRPSQV